MHARALGPVSALVRQPTEGRARGGGLRVGEMERDNFIAHGAAALMKERLLLKSDVYRLTLCEACGRTSCNDGSGCAVCNAPAAVLAAPHGPRGAAAAVDVPYTLKLLLQEIAAMGIDVRTATGPQDRAAAI